jgi:RNA polymerase sigma-70 factor (ECF subfamily)
MDCPIGTVMSRIYRGRKLLHKLLFEHAVEAGLVDQPREDDQDSPAASDDGSPPVSLAQFREQRTKP